jgi:GNAT superfamily N-acetyltransferase
MLEPATSATIVRIDPTEWNAFANRILEIERQSFPPGLRDERQTLRRLVKSETSIVFGLNSNHSGFLVGYIAGDLLEIFPEIPGILSDPHFGRRDSLYLESLAVCESWRHRGFGTMLMGSFLSKASERGFLRTTGHVARGSSRSIRFRHNVLKSFENWYGTRRTFDYVEFLVGDQL